MAVQADQYEFKIYAMGIVKASVCSSLPPEEVAARMAREITGVGPWVFSREPFLTGESNPTPCNDKPDTHMHYLFVC